MGFRKGASMICVLLMLGSTTIFASAAAEPYSIKAEPWQTVQKNADWKAKAETAKEKWKTLPGNQKAEVYALLEQRTAGEIKMMEKYLELGIIDEDVLTRFKEKMAEKLAAIKQSGELPLFAERNARPNNQPKNRAS